ncbi:MAG TPA: SUMF1/EgtB/PvdO family nonheme iron enzyme [Ktedonobacterales bacterium]|nr:SUMF1/EgtB/PvdO family nonheme iron enzyme [Ktedonobacterales bacterium]
MVSCHSQRGSPLISKASKRHNLLPSIFLSHSRADAAWCRPFVEALRQEGYDVWYEDHVQARILTRLREIKEQISTSDIFLVILSPDSSVAPHVQDEIDLALTCNRTIIPVVIGEIKTLGMLTPRAWVDARTLTINESAWLTLQFMQSQRGIAEWHQVSIVPTPHPVPEAFLALWEPGEARLKALGFVPTILRGQRVMLPPLCDIPAGPFLMGNDDDSGAAPQFTIATPAFQLATYPLTVAEYACALEAHVVREPGMLYDSDWATQVQRLDHPVVGIGDEQAIAYAAWLARLTGEDWYVPSEVEWEKAARGTDGRRYPWGNDWDPDCANIGEKSQRTTTPIGSYPAGTSPYGCQDMAGNVWEWTTTLYFNYHYPYDAQDGRENLLKKWTDPESERVFRGGSWGDEAEMGQTTARDFPYLPGNLEHYTGVRLARGLPQR